MEYTITINIKGMMCPHCEATVRGALEAFPEVIKADVSHERGTAEITLKDGNADVEKMKEAVREKGYEVV